LKLLIPRLKSFRTNLPFCFSVDIHTDAIIQSVIRKEFRDCTIISVAHRLNTLVDFDRVVVLHEGRIVECDAPHVLLSRPDSRFKELYEM
jgi:ATP-binding cassette subfamily C (CFTR/MRP) protein 1